MREEVPRKVDGTEPTHSGVNTWDGPQARREPLVRWAGRLAVLRSSAHRAPVCRMNLVGQQPDLSVLEAPGSACERSKAAYRRRPYWAGRAGQILVAGRRPGETGFRPCRDRAT